MLLVGGGGGGGHSGGGCCDEAAGGGGAGQMGILSLEQLQTCTVTVGCGGHGGRNEWAAASFGMNGNDSSLVFGPYNATAYGGGGGAGPMSEGLSGGSSGGSFGCNHNSFQSPGVKGRLAQLPTGATFKLFGNRGGYGYSNFPGGGGGGAGRIGGYYDAHPDAGGNGTIWNITGVVYAGGGSGGSSLLRKGGLGGGGNGGGANEAGTNGQANLGGGGGGGGIECYKGGKIGGNGGSGVVAIAFTCPPGTYVDNSGNNFCNFCPHGHHSNSISIGNVSTCHACPAGKYASSNHTSCITCADGTISAKQGDSQGYCTKCGPGKYSVSNHSICQLCPPGSKCATSDICQGQCKLCEENTFCSGYGCTTCSSCASITSMKTSIGSYGCACPDDMLYTTVSLFSILIQSDLTLRSFTQDNGTSSEYDIHYYITEMLNVELDENGDGYISREETILAMKYRSLTSTVITSKSTLLPLWRYKSTLIYDLVSISELYKNMRTNYQGGTKSFDGSGIDIVTSISTDYPNSSWTSAHCNQYDAYNNPNYAAVQVNWAYSQSVSDLKNSEGLNQVCAYVNGQLAQQYSQHGSQDLSITNFIGDQISNDLSYKRVYCIVVMYLNRPNQYACTVGLYYVI